MEIRQHLPKGGQVLPNLTRVKSGKKKRGITGDWGKG